MGCITHCGRGGQLEVKKQFFCYSICVFVLSKTAPRQVERAEGKGDRKTADSPTKGLEKDLDPAGYSAYKTVISDLEPENLRLSFESSLKLTETLFEKLNIESKLKEILSRIR